MPIRLFSLGFKLEGHGVHTVAQTGWGRPIGKDVSEMRIAPCTADLDADHSMAGISHLGEMCAFKGLPKAWPTTSSVKLGIASKEGKSATDAVVYAGPPLLIVRTGMGTFGTGLPGDAIRISA